MTFLKKHALKLFVLLAVILILFLLWYHLFPVKIPFDHTLYSQNGEEVKIEGEIQYYRSIFSRGGKAEGEVYFGDVKYTLPDGGPYYFVFRNYAVDRADALTDQIIINFIGKSYENFFITARPYPFDISYDYHLTNPQVNIE